MVLEIPDTVTALVEWEEYETEQELEGMEGLLGEKGREVASLINSVCSITQNRTLVSSSRRRVTVPQYNQWSELTTGLRNSTSLSTDGWPSWYQSGWE